MAKRSGGVATVPEFEWRRVLAEHERSGLSVAEFARRRGISAGSLGWWRHVARRRAAEQRGTKARATRPERDRFVEVRVSPAQGEVAGDASRGMLEVVVPGGCVVRVPAHFEVDALRRLLAAFGTRC